MTASRRAFAALALAAFAAFIALGTWQLERRAWKLDLIARVEQRLCVPAAEAPPPSLWPSITRAQHEYQRLRLTGRFDHGRETLVQAVTVLGGGYWVLTPLQTADGSTVLVNRGFVPPERRERATRRSAEPAGDVVLTGLLRLSEPGGTLLRDNDAKADRWYSRDVAAISAARGLTRVAPYFVDADAAAPAADALAPVGGLTVTAFRNHHAVYALTWYTLALMLAIAVVWVVRSERRRR